MRQHSSDQTDLRKSQIFNLADYNRTSRFNRSDEQSMGNHKQ